MKQIEISHIPSSAGVYFFKDINNVIIYIGKAKYLKKRIASYFQKKDTDWKVNSLLNEFSSIDYVITKTEHEALLLEATLIKEHQPKFNVLLKSGQPFLYLSFTNQEIPSLELVRTKKKKGIYFGPFIQKQQARGVYNYLLNTFKLSLCSKKIDRGCLRYHMGLCAGSCMPTFNKEEYLFRIHMAIQALKGNHHQLLVDIKERIKEVSGKMAFEQAKNLSLYLQNLDTIIATLKAKFSEKKYASAISKAILQSDYSISQDLQQFLNLEKIPESIDCFDISHTQGKEIVGSCIRFIHGVPAKNKFRRFKIKTLDNQNDYAALQEIVSRRYKNGDIADIVMIDGGKGQLNAIKKLLPSSYIISLAKREERLFTPTNNDGILLNKHTKAGKLLLSLRDYAHHFAITYHRTKRTLIAQ